MEATALNGAVQKRCRHGVLMDTMLNESVYRRVGNLSGAACLLGKPAQTACISATALLRKLAPHLDYVQA